MSRPCDPEVDVAARKLFAQALRWLMSRRLTNLQYESATPRSRDPAICEIDHRVAWPLYSDTREHSVRKLSSAERRFVARCILFLHSALPYRWERRTGTVGLLRSLLVALRANCWRDTDDELWPFESCQDLHEARRTHLFMRGPAASKEEPRSGGPPRGGPDPKGGPPRGSPDPE